MRDYFGYDVVLTMNITDIDDKIIMRSNAAGVPFEQLAREQELSFLADMDKLGVQPPDVMTRVSEYVPEVIAFVQKIIDNGFAYASNGSVYFDVQAYQKDPRHMYGKLVPENVGNKTATEEGEGALSAGVTDKRDGCDFVLWKASKPGEPFWSSPWGNGRPGWHIECSAMCGETLGRFSGGPIDIHSGGVDLRFPHHENEIAQSEACYGCRQWVNYFVHSGHLHIEGLKMSKSLKNFIKISDALEHYGARQLRLAFLLQRYNAPMNYSERAMEEIAGVEKYYSEFFANVKATLRGLPVTVNQHWAQRDIDFQAAINKAQEDVRKCLADDFDTPGAMSVLADLVRECNKYMAGEAGGNAGLKPVPLVLKAGADYVSRMFRVFGLIDAAPSMGFGTGVGGVSDVSASEASGGNRELTLAPYLDALTAFREQVRDAALKGDVKAVLAVCDLLRDEVLPPLGVKLEDGGSASAAAANGTASATAPAGTGGRWKLRDPEDIRREIAEKKANAEEKARKKAEAAVEAARKLAEKEAKAAQDPKTMFLPAEKGGPQGTNEYTGKYSAWDAEGVPTHAADGTELAKSAVKNLKKAQATQAKLHEWLLAKQAGKPSTEGPEGDE